MRCRSPHLLVLMLCLLLCPVLARPQTASLPKPALEVGALLDKANAEERVYHWPEALRLLDQALTKARALKDLAGEATTLNNIGYVYDSTGQPQKALDFYQQALPLRRQAGDKSGEATTLHNIGGIYYSTGQPQKALDFFQQALPLLQAVGDKSGEAVARNSLGVVYDTSGQPQKALAFYQQALSLRREIEDKHGEAITLSNIGVAYSKTGQPQKALACLEQAIPLEKSVGNKSTEATIFSNLAWVEAAQGHVAQALSHARQAVVLLETVRTNIGSLSESKQSFLASNLAAYDYCLHLLLQQPTPANLAEAFHLAQQSKARALLDLLESGKADFTHGLHEDDAFHLADLKQTAQRANAQLLAALVNGDDTHATDLRKQLQQADQALQIFSDTLLSRYPALANRQPAQPLTLSQVAKALSADTALLEYASLYARSGIQTVDQTVLFCLTLKQGQPLLKVYSIARTRQQLAEQVSDFQKACSDPNSLFQTKASDLYNLLLKPAEKQLAGTKRLLLCPDGPLWNLPFQALLCPQNGGGKAQFLLQRYELTYAYSGSTLQRILHNRTDPKRIRPPKSLLAFADPAFGNLPVIPALASGSYTRPLWADSRDLDSQGGIRRLPHTEDEASAIRKYFHDAIIYTGKQAQKATALQEGGQYRILHFATHGYFNDAAPLYSGIVLAQPSAGSPADQFLTANEIFEQTWNADLVVLSACETEGQASEAQQKGEGVIGLTWALTAAGVSSEVVSQWKVSDASTAKLMQSFYEHLKQGQGKAAALREAALSLLRDGQHSHPFYWAPFILIGDWQ